MPPSGDIQGQSFAHNVTIGRTLISSPIIHFGGKNMNQPRFIILSSALFIMIVLSGCSGRTANFSFEKNASPTTFAGPGETIKYT
jgi:hypothetical protein